MNDWAPWRDVLACGIDEAMDVTDETNVTDEQVYGKYSAELLRFASGLVGPSAADDVLSSAFVQAISSPRWSQIEDRRSYLYRTVLNETRQHFRGDRRRLAREFRSARADAVESAESAVDLAETLALLSTEQRAVVFLTYWMGFTVDESATTLSLAPRTVERHLHHARARLRKALL